MSRAPRSIRPALCNVCCSPDRARIELARAGGASLSAVADKFGVSRDSVHRHFKSHVTDARKSELLAGPVKIEALANAAADESMGLLEELRLTKAVLLNQFLNAAETGDRNAVATISRSLLTALDTVGRVTGELRTLAGVTYNTINIFNSPEFVDLQRGLIELTRRHPAVRDDVVKLLRGFDDPAMTAKPVNGAPVTIEAAADA